MPFMSLYLKGRFYAKLSIKYLKEHFSEQSNMYVYGHGFCMKVVITNENLDSYISHCIDLKITMVIIATQQLPQMTWQYIHSICS